MAISSRGELDTTLCARGRERVWRRAESPSMGQLIIPLFTRERAWGKAESSSRWELVTTLSTRARALRRAESSSRAQGGAVHGALHQGEGLEEDRELQQ